MAFDEQVVQYVRTLRPLKTALSARPHLPLEDDAK